MIPDEIEGLGSSAQKIRPNPKFDPTKAALTSTDFFVFSRIDGRSSLRELILMSGLGAESSTQILLKLRQMGAFLFEGETEIAPPAAAPTAAPLSPSSITDWSEEEQAALAEECAIGEDERREILGTLRQVRRSDHYAVLGVSANAELVVVKRSYFELSKRFHPDRYYGKDTGAFAVLLSELFQTATKSWSVLSNKKKREAYDLERSGAARTQSREEHASELFARAAEKEAQGAVDEALSLFSGAVRSHELPRYLRRAATCAVLAGQLDEAETYARRGVELRGEDPSYWRVLADVLRAGERLEEAEEVLTQASEIRTENDVLAGEITRDLEALRRLRGAT